MRGISFLEAHPFAFLFALAALFCAVKRWRNAAIFLGVIALGAACGGLHDRLTLPGRTVQFVFRELFVGVSVFGMLIAFTILAAFRAWSFRAGISLTVLFVAGIVSGIDKVITDAEILKNLKGLQFVQPWWLLLALTAIHAIRVGRTGLIALGTGRRRLAITARALALVLLAAALAEPRLRRVGDDVTVLFLVDRSFSVPQEPEPGKPIGEAADLRWLRVKEFIEKSVALRGSAHRNDRAGVIFFGKRPRLALPPAAVEKLPISERSAGFIDGDYTDIGAAIKLALASFPEGTGRRVVLISDGNQNLGSAEEQAAIARENQVQIDTIALAPGYRNENDVLVQTVETAGTAVKGQRLPVRVLIRNTAKDKTVDGFLTLVKNGDETADVEIEDGRQVLEGGKRPKVRLRPGLNDFRFHDRVVADRESSSFAYKAVFTPIESRPLEGGSSTPGLPGDRIANNTANAAVVARGAQRVLLLENSDEGGGAHDHLVETLRLAKIRVERIDATRLPANKGELQLFLSGYDALVIADVPANLFTVDQMESIRTSVYDQGCGLVMIGGGNAFGPGSYQGTPVEAALPVDCEIKAIKAAGKGGLVLVMHGCEIMDGNKWERDIAKLAVKRLGPSDMVGVVGYNWGAGGGGHYWAVPFQEVGDSNSERRSSILRKIDAMSPGDMPDFDPMLKAAADELTDPSYGLTVKHCIVMSDGDPQFGQVGTQALKKLADAGGTCTTIGVATHSGAEGSKLKKMAESCVDTNGKPGRFYDVVDPNKLPALYMKECRKINQSFILNDAFTPTITSDAPSSEVFAPGLPRPLPKLHGFVRTTKKENVLVSVPLEGPSPYPDQKFPLLASWRYGLGKAVAFTSDAKTIPGAPKLFWDRDWAASEMYRKFWEQTIRWAMREPERGKVGVVAEYRDGRLRVVVDVRDEQDRPLAGMTLRGAVSTPGSNDVDKSPKLDFRPRGGGMYEAEIPAEEAGSYFVNVQALEPERDAKGEIVRNPDGTAKMKIHDGGRTGATIPYSPEYADLESDSSLLKRLSESTEGEFHTESPEELAALLASNAIFRESPKVVRALLPFWFWLVFVAAIAFFVDVATRRVSYEPSELVSIFNRFWGNLRRKPVAEDISVGLGRLLERKAAVDRTRAARRFEVADGEPLEAPPEGADTYGTTLPSFVKPESVEGPKAPAPEDEADTFAKLQKAKRRAKHHRDDEPTP